MNPKNEEKPRRTADSGYPALRAIQGILQGQPGQRGAADAKRKIPDLLQGPQIPEILPLFSRLHELEKGCQASLGLGNRDPLKFLGHEGSRSPGNGAATGVMMETLKNPVLNNDLDSNPVSAGGIQSFSIFLPIRNRAGMTWIPVVIDNQVLVELFEVVGHVGSLTTESTKGTKVFQVGIFLP